MKKKSNKNKKSGVLKKIGIGFLGTLITGVVLYTSLDAYARVNDNFGEHWSEFWAGIESWFAGNPTANKKNFDNYTNKLSKQIKSGRSLSKQDRQNLITNGQARGLSDKYLNSLKDSALLSTVQKAVDKGSVKDLKYKQNLVNRANALKYQNEADAKLEKGMKSAYSKLSSKEKAAFNKSGKYKYGTYEWAKELQNWLKNHGNKAAKEAAEKATSQNKKDQKKADDAAGGDSTEDILKKVENGEMPEPTTLSGKVGKAVLNMFWSTAIGQWLRQHASGTLIFSPAENTDGAPFNVIYSNEFTENMGTVSKRLTPEMFSLAVVIMVLAVIIGVIKMEYGMAVGSAVARAKWYQNIVDLFIAGAGLALYPQLITLLLNLDGAIVTAFKDFMQGLSAFTDGNTTGANNVYETAKTLGFDKATINIVSSGIGLGGDFAGIIFTIIYLCAFIGLAVWINYYYFIRAVVFTILLALGPLFIAMWTFDSGKGRFFNWLREMIGTIFIQCIHALTITFMALFMAWNNSNLTQAVVQAIQKYYTSKTFINDVVDTIDITGLLPGHSSLGSNAAAFQAMVIGFIIMVMFQPLSKALAELFGINANMLDKIHASTSRTLMTTGGIVGGTAIGVATLGASTLAGGVSALGSAGKAGLQAAKAAKAGSKLSAAKNAIGKNLAAGHAKRKKQHALRNKLAQVNGIVGPGVGKIMAASAVAGASDNPALMLAASQAGGAIGVRAARLTNKPLSRLGLNQANPEAEKKKNEINNKVANGELATEKAKIDAENGGVSSAEALKQRLKSIDNSNMSKREKSEAKANAIKNAEQVGNLVENNGLKARMAKQAANNAINGKHVKNASAQRLATSVANKVANGSDYDAKMAAKNSNYDPNEESSIQNKAKAINFDLEKWRANNPKASGESQASWNARANAAMAGYKNNVIAAGQKAAISAGAAADNVVVSSFNGDAIEAAGQKAAMEYEANQKQAFQRAVDNSGLVNGQTFDQYKASSQYASGLDSYVNDAKADAAVKAAPAILGFSNQDTSNGSDFMQSYINKDTFGNEFKNQMDSIGVPTQLQNSIDSGLDQLSGRSLTSTIPMNNGIESVLSGNNGLSGLTSVDYNLYDALNAQKAHTMNGIGSDTNFTADDFAKIYSPEYNPASSIGMKEGRATAADLAGYFNGQNSMARYADNERAWAEMNKNYLDAANRYDFTNPYSLFRSRGMGSGSSYSSSRPDLADLSKDELLRQGQFAAVAQRNIEDKISSMASGMSPAELKDMLPKENSAHGEYTGVPEGSLMMKQDNLHSWIEAKGPDGQYHQVGGFGPGNGALEAGIEIAQEMNLDSQGMVTPRIDDYTHKPVQPYQLSDDGAKVPVLNQMPSPATILGSEYARESISSDSGSYSSFHIAPALTKAMASHDEISYDVFQANGYEKPMLYGDANGVTMTAIGPSGNREIISETMSNKIWPSVKEGVQFSLPLEATSLGWKLPTDAMPDITFASDAGTAGRENIRDDIAANFEGYKNRDRIRDYANVMLPQTKSMMRNYISKNSPYLNVNELDTFGM